MCDADDGNSFYPSETGLDARKAKLGLPDRWIYCPSIGSNIAKHFLPFKTPLCVLYDEYIGESGLLFHPKDVFAANAKTGDTAKIGLWIDLTRTNRFYCKKEVESRGCTYVKSPMKGHKEVPTCEQTEMFCNMVQDFLQNNPSNIVAVHCTHGFNRTGFLICAYLASRLDWSIDAAISMFAKHRHGGIYKQDYINELFKRYGDEEDIIQAPPQPTWDNVLADNSICEGEEDEKVPIPAVIRSYDEQLSANANVPLFMDGRVPLVKYVTDPTMRGIVQKKIAFMCDTTRDGFPGCQPISIERSPDNNNIKLLSDKYYMVSWKADGMRYMVLIDGENSVFALDRDNNVFRIPNVRFPNRKGTGYICNTLVDTEMIIEKVVDSYGHPQEVPRLLIYDIVKFEDTNVGECNFKIRLNCINNELIMPRKDAMMRGTIKREEEPISIRRKDFWELEAVPKFFSDKFTNSLGHEVDGLIFQPVDEPYKPGRADTVLKWKPPTHNSIDFHLRINRVCRYGELPEYLGLLYVLHETKPVAQMKATKKLQPYDNKIIECIFKDGKWEFMRERTDKSLPNSIKTARAVFNSIRYPITRNDLIDFVRRYGQGRKRPFSNDGSGCSNTT